MLIEIRKLIDMSTEDLFKMSGLLKMQKGDFFVLLDGVVHSRWETHDEAYADASDLASWFS